MIDKTNIPAPAIKAPEVSIPAASRTNEALLQRIHRRREQRGESQAGESTGGGGLLSPSHGSTTEAASPAYGAGGWLSHQAASMKNDVPPEVRRPVREPVGPPDSPKVEMPKRKLKL